MAERSATSKLKFGVGGDTRAAENAVVSLTDKFRELRSVVKGGVQFPDLKLIELQTKAGLRPMQDLKRALAETIGQAKLANKVQWSPINDEAIAKAVVQLKALRVEEKATVQETENLSGRLTGIGKSFQNALLPLAGISAGLVLGLQNFGRAGQDFGTQLRLISTISKDSGKDLQALGQQILKTSVELQADPVDLAAARYEILSSGVTGATEAFKTLEASTKLAKAGVGTVAESADILTSSLNALGGDPARNAEILYRAVDLGKVKISELAESFGGVASQAAVAGVSLEEISATVATLSLTGQNAAEGLTGIRAILTAVSKQGDESVKTAKALGLEFNTAAIRAKGLAGFLADVAEKSKGSDETLSKLFGRVEGLNTALSLGTINAGRFREILNEVSNSTGALDEAFQRTLNPVDRFTSSLTALRIEAGGKLIDAFSPLLNKLSTLFSLLRQDSGLLSFATGLATSAAGVGGLSVAFITLSRALAPIPPLITAISTALNISFLGSLGLVVVAFAAFKVAFDGWLSVLRDSEEASRIVNASMSSLEAEVTHAGQAILEENRSAAQLAKQFDNLQKKTNKTASEKAELTRILNTLIPKFPELKGKVDELAKGYGSLEDAVYGVIKAQTIQAETNKIDEQIAKVKDAMKTMERESRVAATLPYGGFGVGAAQAVTEETRKQKPLQEKLVALEKQKAGIRLKVERDVIAERSKPAAKKFEIGKAVALPDTAALNKIKTAREQLGREIQKIEEKLTGFLKGEIEKRKIAALNDYNEQIKKIKETAATAKEVNSPRVIKALAEARQVYSETLKQIGKEEKRATENATIQINQLQAQINQIKSQQTIGNPFDDLVANADAAQRELQATYVQGVQALQDLVQRDPGQLAFATQRKAQLQLAFAEETKLNKQKFERDKADLITQLNELKNLNIQSKAELSGDEIKIEEATNKRILDNLQTRIDKQAELLNKALNDLSNDPGNAALQAGVSQISTEMDALLLERDKQQQESAQRTAQIQVDAVKSVIESIKQEIELLGMRPELVDKLLAANVELTKELEKQRDITGQTTELRQQNNREIRRVTAESAELSASTDSVSQLLDNLGRTSFGNSSLSSFFSSAVDKVKQLRIEYKKFQSLQEADGKTGTLADFVKNPDIKNQFRELGNQAAQAVGQAFSGTNNPVTSAIGKTIQGIASALSAGPAAPLALITQGIQAAANESGGFLKKYAAFIDLLGFRKIFGSGNKSAMQKAQENLAKTQTYMQQLTANLDTNDLLDLTSALNAALRFKSGGGEAFKLKKQTVEQIKKSIEDRKKTIEEAIKDITLQNTNLTLALTKLENEPIANLSIDRTIQLNQLTAEREKALEAFKDSLEAQNLIEKNYQLQREALYKQSAQDILDTVVEEQNNIRSLRAQTLVSEARTSGNQASIINANLQAQLVALDNEIAAFKGAEETKTEFLKAKAAERTAIIKDANDQVQDLFRQGLDVINEGLVVGETKAESQKRRLQNLFGTLNPLGLIQQDGNLVQTNVTVGSGAFQFILNGIEDAQGLINQLSNNPVLQGQLMSILNIAAARA